MSTCIEHGRRHPRYPIRNTSLLMDALAEDKDIRLQVRHEETGALVAVMQAKFGGSIGL